MPSTILIVDDQITNLRLLEQMVLSLGHVPILADDGRRALETVRREPPDLILLDLVMPGLDGLDVLRMLKADPGLRHIPVILISGNHDLDGVARALQAGADDYVFKPFHSVLLRARIESSLTKKRVHDLELEHVRQVESFNEELRIQVKRQVDSLSSAQLATIFALSKLAESRDLETGRHLERIREYCRALAIRLSRESRHSRRINASFIENVYNASPLHDIGKVGVPDAILRKPGKLTPEEFEILKTHTTIGANTLREVDLLYPGSPFLEFGTMIAESHHERWDGRGYPHGAAEEAIPLAPRILAVCDVYDALTSRRCYKEPQPHEESCELILAGRGTQFDPVVADAFWDIREEFREIKSCFRDPDPTAMIGLTRHPSWN